jgi:hypothetical protein
LQNSFVGALGQKPCFFFFWQALRHSFFRSHPRRPTKGALTQATSDDSREGRGSITVGSQFGLV